MRPMYLSQIVMSFDASSLMWKVCDDEVDDAVIDLDLCVTIVDVDLDVVGLDVIIVDDDVEDLVVCDDDAGVPVVDLMLINLLRMLFVKCWMLMLE